MKLKEAIERVKSQETAKIRVLDKGIKEFPTSELSTVASLLEELTLSNNIISGNVDNM